MRGLSLKLVIAVALGVAWMLAAADAVNMSGTWNLNTRESKWGAKSPVPHEAKVTVEHSEPTLKYSGWVQQEDGPRNAFSFDGMIDGKEYPIENGTIRFRRLGPNSVESVQKSTDGAYEEKAITTISPDGKRITRRIQGKGPHGTLSWTEVYDKLQ